MAVLDEFVVLVDFVVWISVSIGIALHFVYGCYWYELLWFVDIVMYEVKRTRSTIVVYDWTRDPDTLQCLWLVGEFREVIECC